MLAFIPRSPENVKQIYDYLTEHHNQVSFEVDHIQKCFRYKYSATNTNIMGEKPIPSKQSWMKEL